MENQKSDEKKGFAAGRKQRQSDLRTNRYPQDRPAKKNGRSVAWIASYKEGYDCVPCAVGRPRHGKALKKTSTVSVDANLLEDIKKLGISGSECFAIGAAQLIKRSRASKAAKRKT